MQARVALTFPERTLRAVWFVLEESVGDSWNHRHNHMSDGPGTGSGADVVAA